MSPGGLTIVPLEPNDWSAVRAIYLEGIATGDSTFEKSAPEWEKWDLLISSRAVGKKSRPV